MSDRVRHMLVRIRLWIETARHRVEGAMHDLWRAFWCRPDCMPVEVLLVDRTLRRATERHLRATLCRLWCTLGDSFPSGTAVIVQRIIVTDHQLAGCYQIGQHPDGTQFALIRLALDVDGHSLSTDEILSVLAEQCIALAMQQSASSLLIPIVLHPAPSGYIRHATPMQSDPLTAHAQSLHARGA